MEEDAKTGNESSLVAYTSRRGGRQKESAQNIQSAWLFDTP